MVPNISFCLVLSSCTYHMPNLHPHVGYATAETRSCLAHGQDLGVQCAS